VGGGGGCGGSGGGTGSGSRGGGDRCRGCPRRLISLSILKPSIGNVIDLEVVGGFAFQSKGTRYGKVSSFGYWMPCLNN